MRGPWITVGYHSPGGVEVTPGKFHDGWLRTGDVGHITSDGYLTLINHVKDVIKSGGEWISSIDLENLIASHPAVGEAAVIGVPDDRWGRSRSPLSSSARGETVSAAELHSYVAGSVAKWQVPEQWTFLSEVPKTSVGKFDKKLLRSRYADGGFEVASVEPRPPHVPDMYEHKTRSSPERTDHADR